MGFVNTTLSGLIAQFTRVLFFTFAFLSLLPAIANVPQFKGLNEVRFSSTESFPLPPGQWKLEWKDDFDFCNPERSACNDGDGRAMTLRNYDATGLIHGIVIRHTNRAVRNWSTKFCYERKAVELHDFHGTQESWNLNKCSYGQAIGRPLIRSDHWYWTRVRPGLERFDWSKTYFLVQVVLQSSQKRRYQIDILIDRGSARELVGDPQLSAWKALYVDTLAESLFGAKAPTDLSVLALNATNVVGQPVSVGTDKLITLQESFEVSPGKRSEPSLSRPPEPIGPEPSLGAKPNTTPESLKSALPVPTALSEDRVASLEAELARMRDALKRLQDQKDSPLPVPSAKSESELPQVTVPRYGLVVGNAAYKNVPVLDNSAKDAEAFGLALKEMGFQVSMHLDVSQRTFNKIVRDFKEQLKGGEEVVFYFAGHGVQLGSTNYLLPTDVGGDSAEQVKDEAIDLQRVLDSLSERDMKFALAVVDACRDNPFKGTGRSIGGRGLAPTSAATGQMIIFSAGTGQQALDRLGPTDKEPNGVFTRVFLREMRKPGVPVDSMLRQVRKEVVRLAKTVGHEQVPALYDQTVGEFYFKAQ